MGNSGRIGFTLTSETMLKVLAAILLGGFLFVLAGNELVPIIDDVARSLGFQPYEEGAINAGKAMSYAISCTSMIHASTWCGNPSGAPAWDSSEDPEKCDDIEDAWNNGPTTSMPHGASSDPDRYYEVGKTCSEATEGGGANFGRIRVECNELDNNNGQCDIYNFALPQKLGGGGGSTTAAQIIDAAVTYLRGHGSPKYLLYYEAMDESFMKDWESRLQSRSMFSLAKGALVAGGVTALMVMGSFAIARGHTAKFWRSMVNEYGPDVTGKMSDAVEEMANKWPSGALPGWMDFKIKGNEPPEVLNRLADDIEHVFTARFSGLLGIESTIRSWLRGSVDEANWQMLITSRLRSQFDITDYGSAAPTGKPWRTYLGQVDEVIWKGSGRVGSDSVSTTGLERAFVEGSPVAGGKTVPELVQAGRYGDARTAVIQEMENVRTALPSSAAEEIFGPLGDDIPNMANDIVEDVKASQWGLTNIVDKVDGMTDDFYFALASQNNAEFQMMIRRAQVNDPGFVDDLVERVRAGDDILKALDEEETSRLLAKVDASICGSRSTVAKWAVIMGSQNIIEQVTTQDQQWPRTVASSLPAASVAYSTVKRGISEACGSGRSPLSAISTAAPAAGTSFAVAAATTSIAAEIKREIPLQAQGVNSIAIQRGGLFRADWMPIKFPMNTWANQYYANLESRKTRLQLASPCYPVARNDANPQKISVSRGTVDARWTPMAVGGLIGSLNPAAQDNAKIEKSWWSSGTRLEDKEWGSHVQGSYHAKVTAPGTVLSDQIMYTKNPILTPVSLYDSGGGGTARHPPGEDEGSFENQLKVRDAQDPYYQKAGFGAPLGNRPFYYNQTGGYRSTGSGLEPDVTFPPISHHGRGIRQIERNDILNLLLGGFGLWATLNKAPSYTLPTMDIEFHNTKWGTGIRQGSNYCYPKADWDVVGGKLAVFGVALGIELALEAADVITAGTSYFLTGAIEFFIGAGAHLAEYAVEESLGEKWPR